MTLRLPQARDEADALRLLRGKGGGDYMGLNNQQARSAILKGAVNVEGVVLDGLKRDIRRHLGPATATRGRKRRSQKQSAVDQFMDQCTALELQPVRELKFALDVGRKWRFDFAWPAGKVAVEIEGLVLRMNEAKRKDGSTYHVAEAGGRHATVEGFKEDCRKYATAALLGWTVLRFEQEMVAQGEAIKFTQQVLQARGA